VSAREDEVRALAGVGDGGGAAGTQIDDVRRSAGVSGSQMTHYFDDKHTLVREVIACPAQNTLESHRHPALVRLDTFEAWHLWAEAIWSPRPTPMLSPTRC
jgi:AcrR family transcriptional regulator